MIVWWVLKINWPLLELQSFFKKIFIPFLLIGACLFFFMEKSYEKQKPAKYFSKIQIGGRLFHEEENEQFAFNVNAHIFRQDFIKKFLLEKSIGINLDGKEYNRNTSELCFYLCPISVLYLPALQTSEVLIFHDNIISFDEVKRLFSYINEYTIQLHDLREYIEHTPVCGFIHKRVTLKLNQHSSEKNLNQFVPDLRVQIAAVAFFISFIISSILVYFWKWPIRFYTLKDLESYIFPLLAIGTIFGNQPLLLGPIKISTCCGIVALFIALRRVLMIHGKSFMRWKYFVGALFLFGFALLLSPLGKNDVVKAIINLASLCVFLYIGAYIFLKKESLIYDQLAIFICLNLGLVLLQTYGISWKTQIFSGLAGNMPYLWETDYNILDFQQFSDFFERLKFATRVSTFSPLTVGDLIPNTPLNQYRPPGFAHANNILSYYMLLGIFLPFFMPRPRAFFQIFFGVVLMVFGMAKIVFLGFLVIILYSGISDFKHNRSLIYFAGLSTFIVGVFYYWTLPHYFAVNFSLDSLYVSVYTRLFVLGRKLYSFQTILVSIGFSLMLYFFLRNTKFKLWNRGMDRRVTLLLVFILTFFCIPSLVISKVFIFISGSLIAYTPSMRRFILGKVE
jgi:hypothetical protein